MINERSSFDKFDSSKNSSLNQNSKRFTNTARLKIKSYFSRRRQSDRHLPFFHRYLERTSAINSSFRKGWDNNTPVRKLFPTLSGRPSPRKIIYDASSEYPQTYYQETIQIPSQWNKKTLVNSLLKNIENINKKINSNENNFYILFLQKSKVRITTQNL